MKKLYFLLPMMMSLCSSQAAWWNPLSWGKNNSSTPHTLSTTHTQDNNISSPLADHTHIKVTPQGDQFITHKALQRIREENQLDSGLYKHTHAAPTPTSAVADITLSRLFEEQINQRSKTLKSFVDEQAQKELTDNRTTDLTAAINKAIFISNLHLRPYINAAKQSIRSKNTRLSKEQEKAAQTLQSNIRGFSTQKQFQQQKKSVQAVQNKVKSNLANKELHKQVPSIQLAQQRIQSTNQQDKFSTQQQSIITTQSTLRSQKENANTKKLNAAIVDAQSNFLKKSALSKTAATLKDRKTLLKDRQTLEEYLKKEGEKLVKVDETKKTTQKSIYPDLSGQVQATYSYTKNTTYPDYYSLLHLKTLQSINKAEELNLTEKELKKEAQSQTFSAYRGAQHCSNIIFAKNQASSSKLNKDEKKNVEVARDILSYLYTHCYDLREDKQGFHEGTFFVKDKKLTQFFRKYYDIAQNKEIQSIYLRDNSHGFKDSFGIDLPQPFAGKFNTILVGFKSKDKNEDDGVWIKPEREGCKGWFSLSTITHLWHFAQSQSTKAIAFFTGKSADDADIFNKERVPVQERNKFQKLFKDCRAQPKNLTLHSMYKYTLQQARICIDRKQKSCFNEFARELEEKYSNIKRGRKGREIFLTKDNLLSSYFMRTQKTQLIGLYNEIIKTKDKINKLKSLEQSRKQEKPIEEDDFAGMSMVLLKDEFPHTKKQIQRLIRSIDAVKQKITNPEVKEYLTTKSSFFTDLLGKSNQEILKELATQPIFDQEYHQNVLDAQKEYRTNTKKIARSQALQEHLQAFSNHMVRDIDKKLKEKKIKAHMPNQAPPLPRKLEAIEKEFGNTLLAKEMCFWLDQQKGLDAVGGLALFNYHSDNPLVPSTDFSSEMKPILRYMYYAALEAHKKQEDEEFANSLKQLRKQYNNMWNNINSSLEDDGCITSRSKKGKKIIEEVIAEFNKKIPAMLNSYYEKAGDDKESLDMFEKYVKKTLSEINKTLCSSTRSTLRAAHSEKELRAIIKEQFENNLKTFHHQPNVQEFLERVKNK